MARLARVLWIGAGVAVAFWLLPASIHIVDWPAAGPRRVALLAPPWQLWTALAVVAAAALAIGVRRTGPALERALATLSPLGLLWIWTLPYLPWLPDRAPLLLALAGPMRWGVAALAIAGSAAAARASRGGTHAGVPLPGRKTVFTVSLAVYLGFGLWSAAAVGPGADEPHYLVITQSLLKDHDLAIENNHTRGDYREYYGGDLRPDFLQRGVNEVIYSIHAPGLPALLVPAFAAAGYPGAVAMLCLFAALTALAVFDLAALVAGRPAAWLAWAAVCLTVPFVPHSWLIFPEIPGALLTAWAALWLVAPPPARARAWIWRGTALAVLPWLHTKLVIILASMAAALCLRLWRDRRAQAALLIPIAVSSALWLYSFRLLYGVVDPQIPYGDFPRLYVVAANIPRGVLGLLFDQKFGLLAYAPIYLVALTGSWLMLRRPDRRLLAIALLATIAAFVASSTRMYMWWGGSSAPARFLVPILPLAAPLIATAFAELRSPALRAASALLLAISVTIAALGVAWPRRLMLFSAPHGLSNIADAVRGASPLPWLLPTFTEEHARAPLELLAPWAFASLIALAIVAAGSRARSRRAGWAVASAALVAFYVGGAVLAGAPANEGLRLAEAQRGRFELLRAADAGQRALDYGRFTTLDSRRPLDGPVVSGSREAGTLNGDPARLAGPFALAPGRYRARIAFDEGLPHAGAVSAAIGDGISLGATGAAASGPAELSFDMPVDTDVWIAASNGGVAEAVERIDITAEAVTPKSARPRGTVHRIEPVAGKAGAFIAYMDEETYAEGGVFWTKGTHEGTVLIVPAGASTLTLGLHVGAAGGRVRLTVNGDDRSMTLAHDETRAVDVPIGRDDRRISLSVASSGTFRPSDHEPGSTDRRWLGCQVRVSLR